MDKNINFFIEILIIKIVLPLILLKVLLFFLFFFKKLSLDLSFHNAIK